MYYTDDDLRAAARAGLFDEATLARLLAFLSERGSAPARTAPRFDLSHLLWYAGALIVIGAMGLFSTLAFSQMGGLALTATAVVYAVAFTAAGHHLWHGRGQTIVGGLLVAIAVSMAPLAVYGIQEHFGVWSHGVPGPYSGFYTFIKASWVYMEIAAVFAAALALRFYPFPFIVMIAAVALWFMSMDVAVWIAGKEYGDWEIRRAVSQWFGLGIILLAWLVDVRKARHGNFAFWLHLFGILTFWGAVTSGHSDSEIAKAVYGAMNVGLILLAVFLGRRVYAVFGALGLALYLGHLAEKVFKDSLLFPFGLSLIGIAIIAAGLVYNQRRDTIAAWLDARLPPSVQRLRPVHALGAP
jgi:hypothetical protein